MDDVAMNASRDGRGGQMLSARVAVGRQAEAAQRAGRRDDGRVVSSHVVRSEKGDDGRDARFCKPRECDRRHAALEPLLAPASNEQVAQPERLRSVNLGVSQRDTRSEHRGGGVILSVAIRQNKVSEKAPHVQLPQKLRLSFQYEPGALSAQYLEGAHALDVEANAGIGNFDPSGRC